MTTAPLSRPLTDNRMQRALGATMFETSRLDAIRATMSAPTMGELAASAFTLPRNEIHALPDDVDLGGFLQDSIRLRDEIGSLQGSLRYLNEEERGPVLDRIEALSAQRRQVMTDMRGTVEEAQAEGIASGRMLSVDELNEAYGEIGVTFDFPMSREDADAVVMERREEIIRDAVIARSPGGVMQGVGMFGASLLAMATDPLEVAANFIPVVSQARAARLVTRFGRVGGRVATGVIEGTVGQAVTEPIYYGLSRELALDYGMTDALFNIGLGAAFGASVGGVLGSVARNVDAPTPAPRPQLEATLQRDIAEAALRQFTTDRRIDVSAFLDGRDLRGTTALSRADGVTFQAPTQAPTALPRAEATRPVIEMTDDAGIPARFETVQQADRVAEQVGGTVRAVDGGFAVTTRSAGDFIRDPRGRPVEFQNERAAQRFIDQTRDGVLPPDARVVRQGNAFRVVSGMTDREVAAIEAGKARVDVPQGVDTRERAVLPDAQSRIDRAARGVVAERLQARQLAQASQQPHSFAEDARRMSPVSDALADNEIAADVEELTAMVGQIDEARLTPAQRADMEDLAAMDERTRAFVETTNAAAACLARV